MFNREIKVYSVVLVAALIVGYLVWKQDQSPKKSTASKESVTVLDLKADQVASAKLDSEKITTTLTFKGTGDDRWIWIERVERKEKRIPQPMPEPVEGESPAPTPEPKIEVTETTKGFTGGAAAISLIDRLAPLKATRKLGKVDNDAKSQFDLDDPKMTLTVATTKGKSYELKVGGEAPGGGAYYLMDGSDNVYLVSQSAVKPFTDSVTGLMQKTVHNMSEKDIAKIVVTSDGRTAEYEQRNRTSARDRYWARKSDAANPPKDEQFKTWLGKLRRLPIIQYPDQEEEPSVTLTLVYTDEAGKEMGKLELSAGSDGKPALVRTEKTRVWAEINQTRAEEVISEISAIVGGSG